MSSIKYIASSKAPRVRPVDLLEVSILNGPVYKFAKYNKTVLVGGVEYTPLGFDYEEIEQDMSVSAIPVRISVDDAGGTITRLINRRKLVMKDGEVVLRTAFLNFAIPGTQIVDSIEDTRIEFQGDIDYAQYPSGGILIFCSSGFGDRQSMLPARVMKSTCNFAFADPFTCAYDLSKKPSGIPEIDYLAPATYTPSQGGEFSSGNTTSGTSPELANCPISLVGWVVSFNDGNNETQFRTIGSHTFGPGSPGLIDWSSDPDGVLPESCSGQGFDLYRPMTTSDTTLRCRVWEHEEVSTNTSFRITPFNPAPYPDDYFRLGRIVFETGRNAGVSRMTTKNFDSGTLEITTRAPLPFPPRQDDLVVLEIECDKTVANCSRYEHNPRFGGFATAPKTALKDAERF